MHGSRGGDILKDREVKVDLSTKNQGGKEGRGIRRGSPQPVEQAVGQGGPQGENRQSPCLEMPLVGEEERHPGITGGEFTGEIDTRPGGDAPGIILPENGDAAPGIGLDIPAAAAHQQPFGDPSPPGQPHGVFDQIDTAADKGMRRDPRGDP